MAVDALVGRWRAGEGRRAFSGVLYDARPQRPGADPRRVMLLTPHTYMNRSGQAVRALADFYKAQPQDVLVVLDDLALPVGRIRARAQGSSGGHNGLADVLAAVGGQDVPRLRIGIGPVPEGVDAMDFVLRPFEPGELEMIRPAVETACEAVEDWVFDGIECVMERYNRKQEN